MIQIMHLECISMLPGKGHTTFCIFITPILEKNNNNKNNKYNRKKSFELRYTHQQSHFSIFKVQAVPPKIVLQVY